MSPRRHRPPALVEASAEPGALEGKTRALLVRVVTKALRKQSPELRAALPLRRKAS